MKKLFSLTLTILAATTVFAAVPTDVQEQMNVRLVELDVTVTDLVGRSVAGLTGADFVIRESGVVQQIDSIEEINLKGMNAKDAAYVQPRTIVLLDYQNTSYNNLYWVFPQLKQLIQNVDDRVEIALAANAGGIHMIQGFTNDKDQLLKAVDTSQSFYRRNRGRLVRYAGMTPDELPGRWDPMLPGRMRAQEDFARTYYQNQLEVLGQFVHFLGGYSGKKNIILVSEAWSTDFISDSADSVGGDNTLSLKDIQTAALLNKISIDVVNLNARPPGAERNSYYVGRNPSPFAQQQQLAALTSGFTYTPNNQGIANVMNKIIEDHGHFYRIRYYSNKQTDRFRNVRVTAKGYNRIAYSLGGYYPGGQAHVDARANLEGDARMPKELVMETDWMVWELSNFVRRKAYYAVAQRAYNANGELIAEEVIAGSLSKRNLRANKPLQTKLNFKDLDVKPARVEVEVIDLISGKRLKVETGQRI